MVTLIFSANDGLAKILAFLGCTPFAYNWDKTIAGHYVDLVAFMRWNGICNLLIDVLILLLPMPMVWRLVVPTRQRFELSAVFLLGLLYVYLTSLKLPFQENSD